MKIVPSNVNNLIRDGDTGIYYARGKIRQKVYIRSLGQDATTKEKALLRLDDKLQEIRGTVPGVQFREAGCPLDSKSTLADAFEIYKQQVEQNGDLRPSTKEFRLRPPAAIDRNWPGFFAGRLTSICQAELDRMIHDVKAGKFPYLPTNAKSKKVNGNSPTSVNSMIAFFRDVFEISIRAGVLSRNPAKGITPGPRCRRAPPMGTASS